MSLRTWSSSDLRVAGFAKRLVTDVVPAAWRHPVPVGNACARGLAVAVAVIVLSSLALAQDEVTPPGFSLSGPNGSISSVTIKRGRDRLVGFHDHTIWRLHRHRNQYGRHHFNSGQLSNATLG